MKIKNVDREETNLYDMVSSRAPMSGSGLTRLNVQRGSRVFLKNPNTARIVKASIQLASNSKFTRNYDKRDRPVTFRDKIPTNLRQFTTTQKTYDIL